MAPLSAAVLTAWRALARGLCHVATVATVAGVALAPAAADAVPVTVTTPVTRALAPLAARPEAAKPKGAKAKSRAKSTSRSKTRSGAVTRSRKAGRASGARATARAATRAAARERRRAGRARDRRSARRDGAAPEPLALAVPAVEVPEVAVVSAVTTAGGMAVGDAASAEASWEAMLTRVAAAAAAPGEAPPEAARGAGGPLAALSRSATSLLDGLVLRARSQLGTRYVYGGAAPGAGLDCSAFVRYVMEALDVRLPRTANQQARVGRAVPRDPALLRPGDLLTFGRGRHTSHVGIYLGEGRFIHASVKSGQVIETTMERNRGLFRRWQGVRRLVAGADSAGAGASGG